VLFGGYFADKSGARLTSFVCTLVYAIATVMTGFSTGLISLLFARALLGAGEAPALSTATRAMTNWLPRERWGFGQGIITHSFARIGTALTPPLIAVLITSFSWRGSFLIVGCMSLVVALSRNTNAATIMIADKASDMIRASRVH
jgi:MFS family permease